MNISQKKKNPMVLFILFYYIFLNNFHSFCLGCNDSLRPNFINHAFQYSHSEFVNGYVNDDYHSTHK